MTYLQILPDAFKTSEIRSYFCRSCSCKMLGIISKSTLKGMAYINYLMTVILSGLGINLMMKKLF
jgi:hypothetical protein